MEDHRKRRGGADDSLMTTILRVVGRYRSSLGSYEAGQELHLDDEAAAALLRDSAGSFESVVPDLSAMSAETATGLKVPDRRFRGGVRR